MGFEDTSIRAVLELVSNGEAAVKDIIANIPKDEVEQRELMFVLLVRNLSESRRTIRRQDRILALLGLSLGLGVIGASAVVHLDIGAAILLAVVAGLTGYFVPKA